MKEYSLNIGEVKTFDYPVTLTCYGLGSCVGLFIQDRTKGISGGAHILLPDDVTGPKEQNGLRYNVTAALTKIIDQFQDKGSLLKTLRAKIAGGASILGTSFGIGQRNIDSLINQLVQRNIYIAGLDVGGKVSRTARFISDSGELLVRTSEKDYRVL